MKMFWRRIKQSSLESDPLYRANLQIARGTPEEVLRGGIQEWVNHRSSWSEIQLILGRRAPRSIIAYEQALAEKTKGTLRPYKPLYWSDKL